MGSVALGENPPSWVVKFAADNLAFVEFERTALPCALLRPSRGQASPYGYSAADMDARSVMEQRLQSLVCCFSMINRVLGDQQVKLIQSEKQEDNFLSATVDAAGAAAGSVPPPVRSLSPAEAVHRVWVRMSVRCVRRPVPNRVKSIIYY